MELNKKIIMAVAFALLVAGMFIVLANNNSSSADPEPDLNFSMTDAASGYPGETVYVDISLDTNPSGVWNLQLKVTWDPSLLTWASSGSAFASNWAPSNPAAAFVESTPGSLGVLTMRATNDNNMSTGKVLTLAFKINNNTWDNNAVVSVEFVSAGYMVQMSPSLILPQTLTGPAGTATSGSITIFPQPTATNGQTLKDVPLPTGYTWVNPNASVGSPGTYNFLVKHNGSQFNIEVIVSKIDIASVSLTLKPGTQYFYTGSQITPPFSDLVFSPSGIASSDVTITSSTVGDVWDAGTIVTVDVAAKASSSHYQGDKTFTFIIDGLRSIDITTLPTRTTYADGEAFNPAGMVVTATFFSGTMAVTGYTWDPTTLAITDTSVTISYTSHGVTETADVSITMKEYSVKYMVGNEVVFIDPFNSGDTVTVRQNFTRTGYNVTDWTIPSDIEVDNGQFTMPSSNVQITASATSTGGYAVKYDANGGTFSSKPMDQTVTPGTTITVQFSKLPQRSGYNFTGWATSKSANSAQYTQSSSASGKTVAITSDTTFYAIWKAVSDSSAQPVQPVTPQNSNSGNSSVWDTPVSSSTLWILVSAFGVIFIVGIIAAVVAKRH